METEIATNHSTLTLVSAKAFLIAHPVGIAIVSGVAVGAGTYFLMNKFLKKKEQEKPVEA
ncbi:MAG: hypothetical protein IMF12_01670 [Proteobacteria bacterium]|nr:hypothetical protein [Pseudomonadota bacterium]